MPWKETCAMKERMSFIEDCQSGDLSLAAMCRIYGISRTTAYKWLNVYKEQGREALGDRSRAPRSHPNATPQPSEERILAARADHPTWGPRKLLAWLARRHPLERWPAPSTIGAILQRNGMTSPRRRRRRSPPYGEPFARTEAPNDTWCADFKGWFRTGDGRRCDPLTISDARSRYLLRCQALETTRSPRVKPIFEAAFREYGLPRAIRTDNGAPFASIAVRGLSLLSVWWIKLGIVPERIEPGRPDQNGRHERMHRTLKQETAAPPQSNPRAQQRAFDRFVREFNEERPHEALGQLPPALVYHPSPRPYPERVAEVEYPDWMQVRRVQKRGEIKWRRQKLFISEMLWGEPVGLEQVDDNRWKVYFAHLELGTFEEEKRSKQEGRVVFRPNDIKGRPMRRG